MNYFNTYDEEQGEKFFKKGLEAYRNKNYYEALICIDNAIDINYRKKEYSMYKGFCYFELGQYSETINYFKNLVREHFDVLMFYYIGFSQYNIGKFDDALTNIQFALKRTNGKIPLIIFEKAIECENNILNGLTPTLYNDSNVIENPISINGKPNEPMDLYYVGIDLYDNDQFEDALKVFNELLGTNENNYELWLYKGKALTKLNKNEEALICFEKSINLKENYEALMNKSIILSFSKDPSAKKYIDKAMKSFNIEENSSKEYDELLNNKELVYNRLNPKLNKKRQSYTSLNSNQKYKRDPIPGALRHEVFKRDGYRCVECGATNKETTLHVDHILPVSQGGTNELNNLQTLCKKCNLAKSNRHWKGPQRY